MISQIYLQIVEVCVELVLIIAYVGLYVGSVIKNSKCYNWSSNHFFSILVFALYYMLKNETINIYFIEIIIQGEKSFFNLGPGEGWVFRCGGS